MGDGEDPGTELLLVAVEAVQGTEGPQEHLVGAAVGIVEPHPSKVGGHGLTEPREEALEGPSLAGAGGIEHGGERIPEAFPHRLRVACPTMKKLLILAILITLGAVAARKLRDA